MTNEIKNIEDPNPNSLGRRGRGLLTPTTFEGAVQFSKTLAASSMVPAAFKGKAGDILVAVQWGSEIGLPPMQALQNIAVINGKPAIYGDAMLALVTAHNEYGGHQETFEGEVATCTVTRIVKGRDIVTSRTFSVGDAKRANLWGKRGPWKDYPKRMLQMRARGFAVRDAFPDALKGVIIREEAEDQPIKDMGTINPLDAVGQQKMAGEDRASEASLVSDDPIDQNMGDLPPDEPVPPVDEIDDDARDWELIMPGEDADIVLCGSMGEWISQFAIVCSRIADDEQSSFEDRRHNVAEFKKLNDDTIARIKDEDEPAAGDLKKSYTKLLRFLSAKAKEAANG